MVVGAGLRFRGGEHVKSIAHILGMSESSANRVVNNFLAAVDNKLKINVLSTCLELEKLANDWDLLSTANDIYFGAVRTINGWLVTTEKPTVPNPAD